MSAHVISPRIQLSVLFALLLLTALTVGVSFLELSGRWHMAAGLGIAVTKATLVVLFFMHVIHSSAATRAVIIVAVFWLVVVLLALGLAIGLAVQYAPGGYLGRPAEPQILSPGSRRPYISPPAPFRGQIISRSEKQIV